MRGKVLFATALVAIVSLMGVFATSAYAYQGLSFPTPCTVCHSGVGTNPVATLVSNDGTTATYNVSGGGKEWAVFQGSDRVLDAGQPGSVGQFSVPVGSAYTLYAVYGDPGPVGVTVVNPGGEPITTHTISVSAGPNGVIAPGSVSVADGSDAYFSVSANAGFHIADVLVDGSSVGALTAYTFTNITADRTISASFAANAPVTYLISANAGANGSISPAGAQNVTAGTNKTFTFTASPGYHVAAVTVDLSPAALTGSYTFTDVRAPHTISVSFAIDAPVTYAIAPSAGAHGSISPTALQNVNAGSNSTFTFTANYGYHVASVLVDGNPVAVAGSYTFTNVRAGHTIAVAFGADTYMLTVSGGSHGTVSPAVDQSVAGGGTSTFTFTPSAGYHVSALLIDGIPVGVAGSYTFTNVREDHSIAVGFAADPVGTIDISAASVSGISPSYAFTGQAIQPVPTVTVAGSTLSAANDYVVAYSDNIAPGLATVTITGAGGYSGSIVRMFNIVGDVCTFSYTAGVGGTIAGTSTQSVDRGDSGSAVTAVADPGYHFAGWSDGVAMATRTDVAGLVDVSVSATFAADLVPAHVYKPVAPSTMRRNHKYTIYGYVAPVHTSGTYLVTLKFYKRNSHGTYVYHNSVKAKRYSYSSTKSKYKASVSLPHSGKWSVRAYHSDATHSASYSSYDYITVK